jgi:hypothetical protein
MEKQYVNSFQKCLSGDYFHRWLEKHRVSVFVAGQADVAQDFVRQSKV